MYMYCKIDGIVSKLSVQQLKNNAWLKYKNLELPGSIVNYPDGEILIDLYLLPGVDISGIPQQLRQAHVGWA